jgi:hypothetical protein
VAVVKKISPSGAISQPQVLHASRPPLVPGRNHPDGSDRCRR